MHATVPYSSTHHGSLGQVDDPFLFTILQQQFTPKLLQHPTRILTHVQNTFAAVDGCAMNGTCGFCGIHYELGMKGGTEHIGYIAHNCPGTSMNRNIASSVLRQAGSH